jgi:hypothetical protein
MVSCTGIHFTARLLDICDAVKALFLGAARFALAEGKWPSLSVLDRRICSLFFYWSTWNVFLGAMLVRAPSLAHPMITFLQCQCPTHACSYGSAALLWQNNL